MDSPLALFWDCKNSPSLYEMDHKCPCVLALELFDVSGLRWLILLNYMWCNGKLCKYMHDGIFACVVYIV